MTESYIETTRGTWPRCQHRSEVGDQQCELRDGHKFGTGKPSPHNYANCSWCAYTYQPCPVHEPTANQAHEDEYDAMVAEKLAAKDRLSNGRELLPDWAIRDLRTLGIIPKEPQ